MKELFSEIHQENDDFHEEEKYYPEEEIPCPNCLKRTLVSSNKDEVSCTSCGQEFIRINNALRFK